MENDQAVNGCIILCTITKTIFNIIIYTHLIYINIPIRINSWPANYSWPANS